MANKNITMKDYNGSGWDTLYPKTIAEQIITAGSGKRFMTDEEAAKLAGIQAGATNYTHPASHPATMITGLSTVATSGSYTDLINRPVIPAVGTAGTKDVGIASGNIPVIGADGKLDVTIMPAITLTDTFVVSTQAAMLALTAQPGDVAIRTDVSESYILRVAPASTLANWQKILTPAAAVSSVAGKTGAVTLTKSDVGLSNVDNTADTAKPVSTAQQTALNLKANLASPTFTGTPLAPTAAKGTNNTQIATTAYVNTAIADVTAALGTKITISAAAPTAPNVGDLWYELEV